MRSRTFPPTGPEWRVALALLASLTVAAVAVSAGSTVSAGTTTTADAGLDVTTPSTAVVVPPATARGDLPGDARTSTLQTTITDVVPADRPNETGIMPIEPGERTLVRGLTSLRGDRNTIIVELATAGNLTVVAEGETRRWDTDGAWSVVLEVPANVTPGPYVVRADDGTRVARAEVRVVEDRDRLTTTTTVTNGGPTTAATTSTTTATTSTTTTTTTTTATTSTTTATTSTTTTPSPGTPSRTTAEPTPGFGWVLAAIAVLVGVGFGRRFDRRE